MWRGGSDRPALPTVQFPVASPGTIDTRDARVRNGVLRQVVGSDEADIIAAVRGDQCAVGDEARGARQVERRDAREVRKMSMTMKMDAPTSPNLLGRIRRLYDQLGLL